MKVHQGCEKFMEENIMRDILLGIVDFIFNIILKFETDAGDEYAGFKALRDMIAKLPF